MLLVYNKLNNTKAIINYRCESNQSSRDYFSNHKLDFIEVNDIPLPINYIGKQPQLCVNPQTNELFYDYMDRELTDRERLSNLETLILQQQGVI
ncbi:hypothetical protein [Clostridium tyrobutyricum]|uniref:hypothetical protein n=1 Tax=Clostridium tyrobutyricum TaxID=1519 RepID=UPI0030CFFAAA